MNGIKYISLALLFYSIQLGCSSFFGSPTDQFFKSAGIVIASEFLLLKYPPKEILLLMCAPIMKRFINLTYIPLDDWDMVLNHPAMPSYIRKSVLLIPPAALISKFILEIGSSFFLNKAFLPNLSTRATFLNAFFTYSGSEHTTISERIADQLSKIIEIHFFTNNSPISFLSNKHSLKYNLFIQLATNHHLRFPSGLHLLSYAFSSKNARESLKVGLEGQSKYQNIQPEERIEKIEQDIQRCYQESLQYTTLFQSIKAAYFFSRFFGFLPTPFPDAYTFLPNSIKLFTQQSNFTSRTLCLLIKIAQDAFYICFYLKVLYPLLEKIHSYVIHPIEKYLFKDDKKRFVPYIISGMILFFCCEKALNGFYRMGPFALQT